MPCLVNNGWEAIPAKFIRLRLSVMKMLWKKSSSSGVISLALSVFASISLSLNPPLHFL